MAWEAGVSSCRRSTRYPGPWKDERRANDATTSAQSIPYAPGAKATAHMVYGATLLRLVDEASIVRHLAFSVSNGFRYSFRRGSQNAQELAGDICTSSFGRPR